MKEKILLIVSPNEDAFTPKGYMMLPPLSLGILSSHLKQNNYDTELVDLRFRFQSHVISQFNKTKLNTVYDKERLLRYIAKDEDDPVFDSIIDALLKDINAGDFTAVGISAGADFSFFEIHFAILIAAYLKKKYNAISVIGGNNLTYLYLFKDTFSELLNALLGSAIYLVKGPGEQTLVALLDLVKKRHLNEIKNLKGMLYLENEEIKANEEFQPLVLKADFDTLDIKNYSIYVEEGTDPGHPKNLELVFQLPLHLKQCMNNLRASSKNSISKVIIPYIFNYNCPYNCAFCVESDINKRKVIIGKVRNVIEDIEFLSEKYQSPYFYFLNNAFNNGPIFADKLCNEIVKKNLKIYWSDCARFNNMTRERLAAMKAAGCQKLVFGFETASKKLLKFIDKNLDLEQAERVLQWCHDLNILAELEVITGLPYEFEEDISQTIDFIQKNKKYINHLNINKYFIVPSSLIGRYPEKYGVQLVNSTTYDDILNQYLKINPSITKNFRVYKYIELNSQRSLEQIEMDSQDHFRRVSGVLNNSKISEFEKIYQLKKRIGQLK